MRYEPQLGARQTEASAAVVELQRLAADMSATVQARGCTLASADASMLCATARSRTPT